MRIALLSDAYPPRSTHGIARQRKVLAEALRELGHDVTVITIGGANEAEHASGPVVRRVAVDRVLPYAPGNPAVDPLLTRSQALYEGLASQCPTADLVDAPLWDLQGLVAAERARCPVVLWLQTAGAHLAELEGRPANARRSTLYALERHLLVQASAWLGDSQSVLESTSRLYGIGRHPLTEAVHLGLPERRSPSGATPDGERHTWVEALIVGRLEQRKGTRLLLQILPLLFRRHGSLVVRIVGADNSAADGWQASTGTDYPTALRRACAGFDDRLVIEGHVDDDRLDACYRRADLVIVPSLYESFGLVYLEAMRAGVPVVAFATGAAPEIFPGGETDGAVLTPARVEALAAGAGTLIESSERRRGVGEAGLRRFREAFTVDRLARQTLAFYERVADSGRRVWPRRDRRPGVAWQVAEALEAGDGVGNIVRRNAVLLSELGQPRGVIGRFCSPGLEHELRPVEEAFKPQTAGLIFHYWGYNELAWMLHTFRGRKALHYHNVTPPEHWPPDSPGSRRARRAHAQLRALADHCDLVIGDSGQNLRDLSAFLTAPKPGIVLYPIVERDDLEADAVDWELLNRLRDGPDTNMLFVGRVARNKRQDQLMRVFDHYWQHINRHARLWLVGNTSSDPAYVDELRALSSSLPSGDRIALTGKASDAAVQAYYRAAHIFLCASEHEGFCIPLAEAMALDVPVVALGRAAVPETLGETPTIATWNVPRVAELAHLLVTDSVIRERHLARQRTSVARFSRSEARARLSAVRDRLIDGADSPLFEQVVPLHVTARREEALQYDDAAAEQHATIPSQARVRFRGASR